MKNNAVRKWDVIVIGGGPAGMIAAARAGERGRSVLLLEKNGRLGKKLSITGGGRCNVTNNKTDIRTMLAEYKDSSKFLFSTFSQYGVMETIDWFQNRGVVFHEENDGRLFPTTNSAETICTVLASELKKQSVEVRLNSTVNDVKVDKVTSEFVVTLAGGEELFARACVVASGGLSRPDTGSTGEGFGWLKGLGHTIAENNSALVPVVLREKWVFRVSGVTLGDVKTTLFVDNVKRSVQSGKLLFTHFGISGPTILNMSSEIGGLLPVGQVTLQVDIFPKLDEGTLRSHLNEQLSLFSNRNVRNILSDLIPKSLTTIILEELGINGETPAHSFRSEDRSRLVKYVKHLPLTIKGLLGADKAIVSSGGVSLREIDFKTMSSKIVPGLYVVGDMLDIDRPSGGYSLQLCWSTGLVAGSHA